MLNNHTQMVDDILKYFVPLGKGANDFPQPFLTMSASSESTRWSCASAPQKKGTLPSAS